MMSLSLKDLKFSMGSTEQIPQGEGLKTSKGRQPNRISIKSRRLLLSKFAVRSTLQKSIASRSSALRQGKFATARSANDGHFASIKAAEKRALTTPVVVKHWAKYSDVRNCESLKPLKGLGDFPSAANKLAIALMSATNEAAK